MIQFNLNALNPFRRSGPSEPPKQDAPAKAQDFWESGRDFFADTWETTKKTLGDAVSVGAQKGREKVEETLWGEYKKDWGGYGDRFEDPENANSQRESTATIERRIASRSKAEDEALKTLSAVDQARYRKLQVMIGGDPLSKEALQRMLLEGRLPGGKDLAGRGSFLENLAALSEQPLAQGFDRASLVSDLIQEAENPVVINQRDKNTCVATSSVMDLALRSPSEYVRLVAGLASPEGKVKLAGGATLVREPKWQESLGGRTQSIHVISGALMELGNGLLEYDPVEDKHQVFDKGLYEGLFVIGANKVLSQLHKRDYSGVVVHRWNLDSVMTRMAAATGDGKRVPVGLAWEDGGHQVVVEGIKDGQVTYLNPHGNRERLPEADFRSRLRSAHFY